jgi:hypothetical protein
MDQNADSVAKSPGSNSGAPQRMVYCVHGRPSNCCVSVLNNQNNADAVSTIIRKYKKKYTIIRKYSSWSLVCRVLFSLGLLCVSIFFWRGLIEGIVTAKVVSSRNWRKKKDKIGESQPFRERTLSIQDKIRPGHESNSGSSAYSYKADALPSKLTRLARLFLSVPYFQFISTFYFCNNLGLQFTHITICYLHGTYFYIR